MPGVGVMSPPGLMPPPGAIPGPGGVFTVPFDCSELSGNSTECQNRDGCEFKDEDGGKCDSSGVQMPVMLPEPMIPRGFGPGRGDGTGPNRKMLLDKKNCIARKFKSECEPLNKKYLGEEYDKIIKDGKEHLIDVNGKEIQMD